MRAYACYRSLLAGVGKNREKARKSSAPDRSETGVSIIDVEGRGAMLESQNGQFQQPGEKSPGFTQDDFDPTKSVRMAACALGDDRGSRPASRAISPCNEQRLCVDAQTIETALDRLSPRDRLMIRLRHFDQLSFERIARGLGLSTKAAQMRWARAVQNLCQELQVDELTSAARSTRD